MSASVWKKCRLGSLGDAIIGLTYSPANIVESGTLVLRSSNIQDDRLSLEDSVYVNKQISDEIRIRYNDILICVRNGSKALIGKSLLLKNECVGETFGAFMTVFRSEYAEFLTHVIKSSDIKKQIVRCTGATINQITNGDLKQFTLYFPTSSDERNRISKTLSTCDAVIQNTQKTIEKYKAIKQGMMQDLFTRGLTKDGKLRPSYEEAPELYKQSELGMIPKEWEGDTLENLTSYVDYRGKTPFKTDSGIQLVTAKNIKNGFIDYEISKEFISKEDYNLVMARGFPKLGDVLFTTEAPVGNVAQINDENVALAQRVIKFRGKESILDNTFLLYSFLSDYFRTILLSESTGSTAQGIKGSRLHKLQIKYPTISEQNLITEKLSSIDSTIQKEEAILAKYKNIKTGLMARLLTPPEDAQIIDETEE